MELEQDKIDLIERIIKNDRKFVNNEDLYDDFFNETCKRSMLIVKTVTSDATLEAYLKKIATTSILNVLKNEGRLRRTQSGFTPIKSVPIETVSELPNYSEMNVSYMSVDIQDTPEDLAVKNDILQRIVDLVCDIDKNNPDEKYLQLYYLRYGNGLTQKEIAQKLSISQSEVSKRLFALMGEVKQALE